MHTRRRHLLTFLVAIAAGAFAAAVAVSACGGAPQRSREIDCEPPDCTGGGGGGATSTCGNFCSSNFECAGDSQRRCFFCSFGHCDQRQGNSRPPVDAGVDAGADGGSK